VRSHSSEDLKKDLGYKNILDQFLRSSEDEMYKTTKDADEFWHKLILDHLKEIG
jgi:hypothetical protein